MSFIKKLLGVGKDQEIKSKADALKSEPVKPLVHASYPPRHDAIPIASAAELLEAQSDLLRRIKLHAATLSNHYAERFETPIQNLATYISNIPASKDSIYGGPGGLFRACVECAFFSYQGSDGKIFTGQLGVEDRYLLEKRWRYICFLSGLLYPIGQSLEKIRVNSDAGAAWLIRAQPILQWAESQKVAHYYVAWPREDVEPGPSVVGGSLSIAIAGVESIRYLEEGSAALTSAASEIASGIRNDFNSIAFDLIAAMWERLKKNERARLPQNYGRVQFGQHNAPIIVDAMRECITGGKWVVNSKTVLADTTGVYLIWPRAAKELLESQKIKDLKGMPSTPNGLLQVMTDERMLYMDAQQSAYVDVADSDGELHLAVKLNKPESCIEGYNPNDYKVAVKATEVAKTDPVVEVVLNDKLKAHATTVASGPVADETKSQERIIPDAPAPAADLLMATLGVQPNTASKDSKEKNDSLSVGPQPKPESQTTQQKSAPAAAQVKAEVPVQTPASSGYEVPEEIEKMLTKPVTLMLARVVNEMMKPENLSLIIKDHKEFVALPFEPIAAAITAPPDLLAALQKNGWLHPDPNKPRAMVHSLSTTKGGTTKAQYVMWSMGFVKKAKLPFIQK